MLENNYTTNLEEKMFELDGIDDDIDAEKIISSINQPEFFRDFGDALTGLIQKKYGQVDARKLLMDNAKNKGIVFNRNTVNNWFAGGRPKKGEQSREHMFMIAFALDFSLEETKELFAKVYLDRSFNLRDRKEFIYFYCIREGHSHKHAKMLLEQLDLNNEQCNEETVMTRIMEQDLLLLKDDIEVVEYIKSHPRNFQINTVSARKKLEYLLKRIQATDYDKDMITANKVDDSCSLIAQEYYRFKELLDKNKDISSISSMLSIIEGGDIVKARKEDTNIFKNTNLPQEIKNRFPTKHTFANSNPTFEELRKMIILLYSYMLWFDVQYKMQELNIEDYIAEMDEMLFDSCLPTLYYGNPYDWLFLYCTLSDRPLDRFRDILSEAIWDR